MTTTKKMTDDFMDRLENIHDEIIKKSGGEYGIRDGGGLSHAAFEILNAIERHPGNSFYIAAVIYHLLATRHYFVDGNKRTAHIAARTWLLSCGYDFKVSYEKAVPFIVDIARNKDVKDIEKWVEKSSIKID